MDKKEMHCPMCDGILDYDGKWGDDVWYCKNCNWLFDDNNVQKYNKKKRR